MAATIECECEDTVVRVDVGAKGKSPGTWRSSGSVSQPAPPATRSAARAALRSSTAGARASAAARTTFRGKIIVGGSLLYRQFYGSRPGRRGLYDNARNSRYAPGVHRSRHGRAVFLISADKPPLGSWHDPDRDAILKALENVIDPELRKPTELDMVRELEIDGGAVSVTIALTVAGCAPQLFQSWSRARRQRSGRGRVESRLA
jgi:hypothetical protein